MNEARAKQRRRKIFLKIFVDAELEIAKLITPPQTGLESGNGIKRFLKLLGLQIETQFCPDIEANARGESLTADELMIGDGLGFFVARRFFKDPVF